MEAETQAYPGQSKDDQQGSWMEELRLQEDFQGHSRQAMCIQGGIHSE